MPVRSTIPMPGAEAPIVKRKLADEVFERLKTMITSGDYAPGQALPSERELMARYGVGRPAIREAMQALANLGLLTISHGERARVRSLTAKDAVDQMSLVAGIMLSGSPKMLENLKQARRFLGREMVREAARSATDGDIADLEAILKRQIDAGAEREAFIEADAAFHIRIAAISGNAIYEAVTEAVLGWLKTYQVDALVWEGKGGQTLVENAEILRCIKTRDAEGADVALCSHLDRLSAQAGRVAQ